MDHYTISESKKILSLVNSIGTISDLEKIQPLVYVLKSLGIKFNEKFKFEYSGVFSSELQFELDDLIDKNVLSVNGVASINKEIYITEFKDAEIEAKKDIIDGLLNQNVETLNALCTIFYLNRINYGSDDEIRNKVYALHSNESSNPKLAYDKYVALTS